MTPHKSITHTARPKTVEARARAFLRRMPSTGWFSHETAALLWTGELPPPVAALHVSVPSGHRAPHANGIRGHSARTQPEDITTLRSLPVTTPERTWLDLVGARAGDAPDEYDVVWGDALLRCRERTVTVEGMCAVARAAIRTPGRVRAIKALPRLWTGSPSRAYSALHYQLVEAGLRPDLNAHIPGARQPYPISFESARVAIRCTAAGRATTPDRVQDCPPGWTVLHITDEHLHEHDRVVKLLVESVTRDPSEMVL
ncbi:hypothetical protein GCM10022198_17980 [Klugiella xanthotipulae]|uniref:Transcriptional regulator with AbiEi antitoxin domain of type IV toxin-antitoxin system n=1 Tax=Klugiella xanthotipulae TaxID=244735 RepID=A0A543HXE5_9MICO|nr:hypothetical protein [Klugiella xanthotipulae]TQM63033.1 hypothetical protein FB466_1282 [Klugiella xanthotipulae]